MRKAGGAWGRHLTYTEQSIQPSKEILRELASEREAGFAEHGPLTPIPSAVPHWPLGPVCSELTEHTQNRLIHKDRQPSGGYRALGWRWGKGPTASWEGLFFWADENILELHKAWCSTTL